MGHSLKLYYFTVLCVCAGYYQICQGDVISSTAHLQDVADTENVLSTLLEQYVQSERERIELLKNILLRRKLFLKWRGTLTGFGKSDLVHSLKMVAYLWSFADDWGWVYSELASSTFTFAPKTDLLQTFKNSRKFLPSDKDFQESRKAILRLQEIYNLPPADLVRGDVIVQDKRYSATENLSAADAFMVGRLAYSSGFWRRTQQWMEKTIELIGNGRVMSEAVRNRVELRDALHHLAYVQFKLGNWNKSLQTYNRVMALDPNNTQIRESINTLGNKMRSSIAYAAKESKSGYIQEDIYKKFARLCKGSRNKKERIFEHKLRCWYNNKHPALLLKPASVEWLNYEPPIVIFHDFTSDKENHELIKLATPWLQRAVVNNIETGESHTAEYRISKSAWFGDKDAEIIKRINRRIEILTGLSTETGEDLQLNFCAFSARSESPPLTHGYSVGEAINNYGLGGHYEPHYDHSRNITVSPLGELGVGNRIATFMIYLSEVAAGGATVFLKSGIRVLPKKGSAIFWYNLLPSGESDWRTLHAGCPVLIGSKWVANKWLHERGQEFLRPCGLKPENR